MKFAFIKSTLAPDFAVADCCRVLRVSQSGYYRFVRHPASKRQQWREQITEEIRLEYHDNRRVFGSHKIHKNLKKRGVKVCENTTAKLMSHAGIRSIRVGKFKVKTTDSNHNLAVADNILDRKFEVEKPNAVWVGDITYIHTREGVLYLAGVMDLFSRRVVGYSMAEHVRTELVSDAMKMALALRLYPEQLLFHSDRGSQYASCEFRGLLESSGVAASMSGAGDCYDNAVIESFWSNLKKELVFHCQFETLEEARLAVFDYIEVFYNRKRIHTTLGDVSPAEFEASFALKQVA